MCFELISLWKRQSTRSWSRPFGKRNQIGKVPKSKLTKAELLEPLLVEQGIPPDLVITPKQRFELPLDEQPDRFEQANLKHRSKLSRKYIRDSPFVIKLFVNEKLLLF